MKRKGFIVLLALMMLSLCIIPASAADVQVVIDEQAVVFVDQQPYIDSNSRTLVPMRAPMEAMGATVSWDQDKKQATFEKGEIIVVFTIGSTTYTINGVEKEMDTQAVLTGNRTCIPIRYAAEALGATVNWDGATYSVLISTAVAEDAAGDEAIDENADEETADEEAADEETADEEAADDEEAEDAGEEENTQE
jgi:hypothetical protein